MQGQAQAVGYTRPDGLNILGVSGSGAEVHLGRYSLTGKLVKVLASSSDFEIAGIDSTDGTTVAVSGTTGVRLFGNAGGLIRSLAVPGTNPGNGCTPAVVELEHHPRRVRRQALRHPQTLASSRQRRQAQSADRAAHKNGSISLVKVPGTLNVNTRVVTALGSRLLIDALTGCPGSNSLLWFNPGTRAEQWLFKAPPNALGVLAVVAYYSNLNASL